MKRKLQKPNVQRARLIEKTPAGSEDLTEAIPLGLAETALEARRWYWGVLLGFREYGFGGQHFTYRNNVGKWIAEIRLVESKVPRVQTADLNRGLPVQVELQG